MVLVVNSEFKTIKKDLRIGKFLSRETTGYQPIYVWAKGLTSTLLSSLL